MLKLFEQIFHGIARHDDSIYPDELVVRATERALDMTDPRIRILSGYARQLHKPVVHAIGHVLHIIDHLPPPVSLSPDKWNSDPVINAMFASVERIQQVVARDSACQDYRTHTPPVMPVTALLLTVLSEKDTFGVDLVGDKVVHDVAQKVISFDQHRLVALAKDEAETRRLLKWRAYDYVLTRVLSAITEMRDKREDLDVRRKLLKAKLAVLSRSNGNLSQQLRLAEQHELQQTMDQVESELAAMGTDDTVLQQELDIIIAMLSAIEQQLWISDDTFYMDSMHIQREPGHPKAHAVPVQMLQNAHGHRLVIRLVTLVL